jgi:hypothetical protein
MKNILKLILFCVPVAYLGLIITVAVHEFGGHAFVGFSMGVPIENVVLLPDGMGWVEYGQHDIPLSNFQKFLISVSGVALTTLFGLIFVFLGRLFYQKTALALFLFIFGLNFILDGVTYTFFNSLVPAPPGDLNYILTLYPEYRMMFVYASGLLLCLSLFYVNYWVFKILESYVHNGQVLSRIKQLILLGLMFVVQSALFLVFDWNQLIEGAGQLPNKISVSLIAIILLMIYLINKKQTPIIASNVFSWKSIIGVWVVTIIAIVGMLQYLPA